MRKFAAALLGAALLACSEQPMVPEQDPAFERLPVADQGGQLITVEMTGAAEVPGPGDPDGSGTFTMTFNPGQGVICYEIEVENIVLPATGAHIHLDATREILVPLTAPDATGSSTGCTAVGDDPRFTEAVLRGIHKNPENYYVNVHNSVYPAGAVRGQLGW